MTIFVLHSSFALSKVSLNMFFFEFSLIKCGFNYLGRFQFFKLCERVTLLGSAASGVFSSDAFFVLRGLGRGFVPAAFMVGSTRALSVSFLSIERVWRFNTELVTAFRLTTASAFNLFASFGFTVISASCLEFLVFGDDFSRFAAGFCGLEVAVFRLVGFGLTIAWPSDSFESSSVWPTKENADCLRGTIGMKKGLGQGELIRSADDAADRIEGIRRRTGLAFDGVFGSRVIGLKKIISVFRESGEEQSLGVSVDEELPSWFFSDRSSFELVEADVDGESELVVIFEKKLMLRFNADLKMLLYLFAEDSGGLIADPASLQMEKVQMRKFDNTKKFYLCFDCDSELLR